jgi:hypothetical protein
MLTNGAVGVCILENSCPGIVVYKGENLHCMTCKKCACEHIKRVCDMGSLVLDCILPGTSSLPKSQGRYEVKSTRKIPFLVNNQTAMALRKLKGIDDRDTLLPHETSQCGCGCTQFVEAHEMCDVITQTSISKTRGKFL